MDENIILTPKQEVAVHLACEWYGSSNKYGPFILTGVAGSGKTTLINFIINELNIPCDRVAFASYTGKAASVLNRKGLPATTIHKLIYKVVFPEHYKDIKDYDSFNDMVKDQEAEKIENYEQNSNNLLECEFVLKSKDEMTSFYDLIVIDEISMVNKDLLDDLLSFKIPIIACGDPFQLQPVGGECNDLINHPHIFLDEPLRQALDSPIIYLSNKIRNGGKLSIGNYGKDVKIGYKNRINESCYLNADQILCGKNITVNNINKMYREKFLKTSSPFPQIGEKLICLKNNYNIIYEENGLVQPLVNGLTCIFEGQNSYYKKERVLLASLRPDYFENINNFVIPIDYLYFKLNLKDDKYFYENSKEYIDEEEENEGNTFFDLLLERKDFEINYNNKINKFNFGYCITVHKAQGSQYKKVLLINEYLNRNTYKNWLYTAITRAEEKLIIVL